MIVYVYFILLAVPKHISWKREAKLQKIIISAHSELFKTKKAWEQNNI